MSSYIKFLNEFLFGGNLDLRKCQWQRNGGYFEMRMWWWLSQTTHHLCRAVETSHYRVHHCKVWQSLQFLRSYPRTGPLRRIFYWEVPLLHFWVCWRDSSLDPTNSVSCNRNRYKVMKCNDYEKKRKIPLVLRKGQQVKTFSRSKIFFVLLIENKRTNAASFFAPKDAPEKLKFKGFPTRPCSSSSGGCRWWGRPRARRWWWTREWEGTTSLRTRPPYGLWIKTVQFLHCRNTKICVLSIFCSKRFFRPNLYTYTNCTIVYRCTEPVYCKIFTLP